MKLENEELEELEFKSDKKAANEKRHKNFIVLIKAISNLIDDKFFLRELLRKYGLCGEEFSNSNSTFDNREKVTTQFRELIPNICEDLFVEDSPKLKRRVPFLPKKISEDKRIEDEYCEINKNEKLLNTSDEPEEYRCPKYEFDEVCFKMLELIHELVLRDYSINNDPNILQVLLQNNMSPLSSSAVLQNKGPLGDEEKIKHLDQIKKIQRFYRDVTRSVQRKTKHEMIFGKIPNRDCPIPTNIKHNSRIIKAIHELTANHSIVNKIQHHFTTNQNLKSIIRSRYIFGNKALKKQNIFFRENAMGYGDVKNGDSDVICFCPYMVDFLTFYNQWSQSLKKDVVRLAVDITKVENYGHYNQFFKLFDLCSPAFIYKVQVTQDLTIALAREKRGKDVILTLVLKGESATLKLFDGSVSSKNNLLCYGNLFVINRYCLLALFRFLQMSENKLFENNFINYLSSCDEDEIKKILVILGQSITIFAEYNFNSALPLSEYFINEIHYVDKNVTYRISKLGSNDYRTLHDLIIHENVDQGILKIEESLLKHCEGESVLRLYGNQISVKNNIVIFQEQDFSNVSAELFGNGSYIETRPQTKSMLFEPGIQKEMTNKFNY